MLENINLSHNQFGGSIPKSIEDLKSLTIFDVSYNNLEGSIPRGIHNGSVAWFLHNRGLCEEMVGLMGGASRVTGWATAHHEILENCLF
jgi:hypothetical protein